MFKKTLSVILAVAMLCTMIPFVALAEETATATATVIAVDDKSATIKVAGVLTEGNTYSNSVVKNGATTLASSILGDEIVVTGLTKATKYDLTVSFDENGTTHTVDNVAVNTLNTLPCMTAPTIYPEYMESIDKFVKLTIAPADSQNESNAAEFAKRDAAIAAHKWVSYKDSAQVDSWTVNNNTSLNKFWAGQARSYVEAPLEFPATGNYYVVAHLYSSANNSGRSIKVNLDGAVTGTGGSTTLSGGTTVGGATVFEFANSSNKFENVACPTPITVTKGVHNVILLQNHNWCRVDSVAFIPESEITAAGSLDAYISTNFANSAGFYNFINAHTPEKHVFFGEDFELNVTESNNVLTGDFYPSTYINEKDVTFKVYLNGALIDTLEELEYSFTINEGVSDGVNTVKVEAVIDGAVDSFVEKTIIVNLPLDAPFFMNGVIENVTAMDDADVETSLDISWTAAQQQVPTGTVTYNVYLNGILEPEGENISDTTYSFDGLTANTDYTVKVITVLDGVESEESVISTLENTFKTPTSATATIESVTDTVATVKVTGGFTPASDYKLFGPAVNGATPTIDEAGVVTISGLTPATKYDVTLTVKESKADDESVYKTHSFDLSFVTTKAKKQSPAPEAIYPEYLKTVGRYYYANGSTGSAASEEVVAQRNDKKWIAWAQDGVNFGTTGLWFEEYWYGSGSSVETTLNFPSAGDYYIVSHGFDSSNGSRKVKVSIDGATVQKDGADFQFGASTTSYLDTPVTVSQGSHIINIANVGGYRLDMVAFVPKTEVDASGKTLAEYMNANFSSKEKFLAFANRHKETTIFSNDGTGLSVSETQPKVLEVTIFPSTYVDEVDATYKLYLNDTLVATLGENEKVYTISQGVVDGKNTIKVEAIVNEAVNSTDLLVVDITAVQATATFTPAGGDTISGGAISLQAPAFLTGTRDVHVLVAAYRNNRMDQILYTTHTLSAGQSANETFTLGEAAKLLQQSVANDPAVRSVKLFLLDETFTPIELTY